MQHVTNVMLLGDMYLQECLPTPMFRFTQLWKPKDQTSVKSYHIDSAHLDDTLTSVELIEMAADCEQQINNNKPI